MLLSNGLWLPGTESSPLDLALLDLHIIGRRELTLLVLCVLVGDVGVDLHHLQRLVAQMALQGEEFASFEQEADSIPMAAGVGAYPLVGDAADALQPAEELPHRVGREWAPVVGQQQPLLGVLWLTSPVVEIGAQE